MHHFALKDGVLHAEDVDLAGSPTAVERPSIAIRARRSRVIIEVFTAALGRSRPARLLRRESQFQPGGSEDAGGTRRRHGRRLRGRIAPGAGRRRAAPNASLFPASARRAAEMAFALEAGIFCFNVESGPELQRSSEVASAMGRVAPVALARQSRYRREDPCQNRNRQGREQIRHSAQRARAPFSPRPRRCPASGSAASISISARRSPISRPSTTLFALTADFVGDLRADGHDIGHIDLGGGLGIPYRDGEDPDSYHPDRYAKIVAPARRPRRLGVRADFRARPADRRQCRHARDAGALREARRGEDLRHRRCGDERSDPPDAL